VSTPTLEPVVGAREDTGWLDLARTVAIVAVLLVHVVAPAVNGSWVAEGGAAWWIANLTDSAGRWCVPVFVMVSGALLLDPRRAEPPREFYRRRLVRIGVPLVAWTLVYLAYRRWWLDEPLTAGEAGRDVLAGTPFLQLYFLYVLVGLYLLTPYLRILIRHTTRRIQVAFAGTLLALGLVDQVAEMLVGSGTANVATGFLPFAGYFVAGWVLRDVALHAWHVRAAALTFVASVAGTAALVGAFTVTGGWDDTGRYLYDFFAPLVVTMSVAAFVLFRSVPVGGRSPDGDGSADGSPLAVLSGVTFGIFLVHPLVLYPVQDHWPLPDAPAAFTAGLLAHLAITVVGSLALTLVLRRIPYVRATVG
jgi:surface polysaccharide O-acyltransferase-like enzyme